MPGSTTKPLAALAHFGGVLLALLLPATAGANIGMRWWGDPVGEPRGLRQVAIVREELAIDLRPLAAAQPVRVEATYRLYNNGPPRRLDLVFVSGAPDVSEFEVRLGGRVLESREVPREQVGRPESWKQPESVRGIEGKPVYLMYENSSPLVAFTVDLPSGASTLTARYRARAAGTDERSVAATWVFAYVLSPAREWGSFGDLEVTAYLPDGWQHASATPLEREGDVLRGRFTGLPADSLAVAVRAPVGPEFQWAIYRSVGLFALAVVAGGAFCWLAGRWQGRFFARKSRPDLAGPGRSRWPIAVLAGVVALLWGAIIGGAYDLAVQGVFAALKGQESPYFHEHFFLPACGLVLLVLCALPLGFLLAWRSACRQLQRGRL